MNRADDPYKKVYHKAGKVSDLGQVSALCYKKPHPIDLSRGQSWTLVTAAVTCPMCRKILALQPSENPAVIEGTSDTPEGSPGVSA